MRPPSGPPVADHVVADMAGLGSPGATSGGSPWREPGLLEQAGMTDDAVPEADTSGPADLLGPSYRGRIACGQRTDLVPTTATGDVIGGNGLAAVGKNGRQTERAPGWARDSSTPTATSSVIRGHRH